MQQSKRALRAKMKKKAANRARNKGMDLTIKANHDREVLKQIRVTEPLTGMADAVLQQYTNMFGNDLVQGPKEVVDSLVNVLDKIKSDSDELKAGFKQLKDEGEAFVNDKSGDYIAWTQKSIGICEGLERMRDDHAHRYSLNMMSVNELMLDIKS